MSYVTTHPEALDFAAGKLEGIGTALAAQNAASAMSTATVAPAAADEVSALQATQFSAYGNLYQQVSEQATAIHQAFVQMLTTSAGSYGDTETANSAATGTASLGGFDLLGQLTTGSPAEGTRNANGVQPLDGRIQERGLEYFADPHGDEPGEINHHYGGRGVYWADPSGNWLEIITVPYGGWPT